MSRPLPEPLKHYLAGLIGAVMIVLAPAAHASYTVMDDDLYPTSYIQARAAPLRQETIQFPRQRRALTKTAMASLDALLPSMGNATIRIIGRPDATAQKTGPLSSLAGDRAITMRDYLVRKGISPASIKMETDESPNPQANGTMYPSEIHISAAAPVRADFAQYGYAPLAQDSYPNQSNAVTIAPVTNRSSGNPGPNAELIRFINASLERGEMSASVALQLLERLSPPPPQTVASTPTWEILAEDKTLQNTFARWGKSANWQVKWIDIPDIKNPGHVTLPPGDFLATANRVLTQAQRAAKAAGIDISITAYPNRVLVISKAAIK